MDPISTSVSASWQTVLTAPAPGQHIAQLYTEPGFLARTVGRFAAEGLRRGEGVVLIATAAHWQAIARRLEDEGLAVDELQHRGQLAVRDAGQCLAGFLVDGLPDRGRFQATIVGVLDAVEAAGFRRIRAFGEMVDLLRRTSLAATIRLEALWSEVLARRGIALLGGYSLDNFDRHVHRGLLQSVSAAHSDLVPVEDYARLEHAVDLAYADVFGAGGEGLALRQAFLTYYARPAAMPDAEAALLAVREFVPGVADRLLDRVRDHYEVAAGVFRPGE